MRGGAAQDPPGKAGLGMLLAQLLDEGAGDLDSQAYQRALDEKAVEIHFRNDREHAAGRMRTLVKNLDRAAELLRLALNAPRFDEEPFERVREHSNARLRHDANDPGASPRAPGGRALSPATSTGRPRRGRSKRWRRSSAPTSSRRRDASSRATRWRSPSSAQSTSGARPN